jgi:hypothetical protein
LVAVKRTCRELEVAESEDWARRMRVLKRDWRTMDFKLKFLTTGLELRTAVNTEIMRS